MATNIIKNDKIMDVTMAISPDEYLLEQEKWFWRIISYLTKIFVLMLVVATSLDKSAVTFMIPSP